MRCKWKLVFVIFAAATAVLPVIAAIPAHAAQAAIPDFSGMWSHPYWPGFELPLSGPGPVTNRARLPAGPQKGVSDPSKLVGDYTNPILKPDAAAVVKRHGDDELRGAGYPTPTNQCWPESVPLIFWDPGVQILQHGDRVTLIYPGDNQVRRIRMNQRHPPRVTPSWYGDSVGHYEDDTLVIDTVGVKRGPFAMADMFGTPYSDALHTVERYRLIDYEAAKEALDRAGKENFRFGPGIIPLALDSDPNDRGKHLQLQFTVEDEGVFTTKWSATITYGRALGDWAEYICAENPQYYPGKDSMVPKADRPDF